MPKYLSNLVVMYAEEEASQPDDIVTELQGLSSDINKGVGGLYVWLQPQWTAEKEGAITHLSFEKPKSEIRNYNNLALQRKDEYRYITAEPKGERPITRVGLFRTEHELTPEQIKTRIGQSGYTNYTADINQGRGASYLYLVWT
ncbi:hypothetical protein Asppvi_003476 [Aspergillus pseudoviridinutans]|uniref:Uncharacterized protein n=1 Tax=Aspergillus pseudoviridinutans TaxID=1517512 RepID=A0A9P3B4K3_9EURO|nr:uncharacterized protein Asppvi_003476 [Aspergillus pseudoviridinutans]GIJ84627.1 hypothetical protein Asppvi_003476 [Aspergillus pseudoviridinutans]